MITIDNCCDMAKDEEKLFSLLGIAEILTGIEEARLSGSGVRRERKRSKSDREYLRIKDERTACRIFSQLYISNNWR